MINVNMIQVNDAFSDIFFEEVPHKYTDSFGTQYTSVTTFVGKFEQEKDWNLIAEKAIKNNKDGKYTGKSVEEVRAEWKYAGDYACALGTMVHSVMELGWQNKEFYPDDRIFAKFPGMEEDFNGRKKRAKEILKMMKETYVPLKNEFIVYDRDWKLCGTIDFLAYNKKKDCVAILDWKTNKKWDHTNRYQKLTGPFEGMDDCNIKHYEIQLNTYKAILEKHTDVKVGEMVLIQIPSVEKPDEIHVCNDLQNIIVPYLNSSNNILVTPSKSKIIK